MTESMLFGQLCQEVMLKKINDELAECDDTVKCSVRHLRRMRYILKYGEMPPRPSYKKGVLVAVVIAAVLLLTACVAILYGEKILNYWVETYHDHFAVSQGADDMTHAAITEPCYLAYVPEGYVLEKEDISDAIVYYCWVNEAGKSLIFTQSAGKGSSFINNNGNHPQEVSINGTEMLCLNDGQGYCFLWNENGYDFMINIRGGAIRGNFGQNRSGNKS